MEMLTHSLPSPAENADSLSPLCAHLGVLHPERQDYRQEGSGCPGRRVLPHYRDAQQPRKGEGGPPSSERIVNEELHISKPQEDGEDQKIYAEISVVFLTFQGTSECKFNTSNTPVHVSSTAITSASNGLL